MCELHYKTTVREVKTTTEKPWQNMLHDKTISR